MKRKTIQRRNLVFDVWYTSHLSHVNRLGYRISTWKIEVFCGLKYECNPPEKWSADEECREKSAWHLYTFRWVWYIYIYRAGWVAIKTFVYSTLVDELAYKRSCAITWNTRPGISERYAVLCHQINIGFMVVELLGYLATSQVISSTSRRTYHVNRTVTCSPVHWWPVRQNMRKWMSF